MRDLVEVLQRVRAEAMVGGCHLHLQIRDLVFLLSLQEDILAVSRYVLVCLLGSETYRSAPTAQSSTYEAAPPKPTGAASYIPASAQGYANTASSYATAGLGRAKEGLDSMMTQQRREQVCPSLK